MAIHPKMLVGASGESETVMRRHPPIKSAREAIQNPFDKTISRSSHFRLCTMVLNCCDTEQFGSRCSGSSEASV